MSIPIEEHPLQPFLPENALVLMLGSFPPHQEKWGMNFYYPNFINDMWRILGLVFFNNKIHFLHTQSASFNQQKIMDFLSTTGIALGDAARKVRRLQNNASDKFLDVIEVLDLAPVLLRIPQCTHIITTGEKSASLVSEYFNTPLPRIGFPVPFSFMKREMLFHRLPSSSRAYPLSLAQKVEKYRATFHHIFPDRV